MSVIRLPRGYSLDPKSGLALPNEGRGVYAGMIGRGGGFGRGARAGRVSTGRSAPGNSVTVQGGAAGLVPDLDQLSAMSGQAPNFTTYDALDVPGMAAGGSYEDPTSSVLVWKLTSATVPAANSSAHHEYSEGPLQISYPINGVYWLLFDADAKRMVPFTRGAGPNYAADVVLTGSPVTATFSRDINNPDFIYLLEADGDLRRVRVSTNSIDEGGTNFPAAVDGNGWLQQDRFNKWFVGLSETANRIWAWNSETDELRTLDRSGLDEPYLERDGRYVFVNHGGVTSTIWDLETDTTYTATRPGNTSWAHMPCLRRYSFLQDVNTGAGHMPMWLIDLSVARDDEMVFDAPGYAPDRHWSGCWIQFPDDLTHQYALVSAFNQSFTATGTELRQGIGFHRIDGGDQRFLCHHFSVFPDTSGLPASDYWPQPHATQSPDGLLVMFGSNMNDSGRVDAFLVEVPTA